jgi:hypothetical protein
MLRLPNTPMPQISHTPAPNNAPFLPGDLARRRALFSLLISLVALPASWLLFSQLERLWPEIVRMEGLTFMAAATLLGGAMAVGPLTAAISFLLAIWFGVDSVYKARRTSSPLLDRAIVATGLVVWFTPALAAIVVVGQALASGRIHFVRPPRDYFLATDPIAFWQGVGFWLIMGSLFAFLAWRYWRGKLLPRSATAD